MKNIFPILLTLLSLSCGSASLLKTEASSQLNTYYVFPKVGIWLRSGPSKESDKLQLIPHSETLRLKFDKSIPDSIENQQGFWLPADYRGFSGFVFSAYLTEQYSQTVIAKSPFSAEAKKQFELLESSAISASKRDLILSKLIGYGLEWTRAYPDGEDAFRFCQAAMAQKYGPENPNFPGTSDELVRQFIQRVNAGDKNGLSEILGNTLKTGCYPCDSIVIRPKGALIQEFDKLKYGGHLSSAKYSETYQGQPFFEIKVTLPQAKQPESRYLIRIKKTHYEHYIDGVFGSHGFRYNTKEVETCELHA